MLVTVKLSPDGANVLQQQGGKGSRSAAKTGDVAMVARSLGVRLLPMHPGTHDPELRTYFIIEVPDRQTADRIVTALLGTAEVEAAYLKPTEEMP